MSTLPSPVGRPSAFFPRTHRRVAAALAATFLLCAAYGGPAAGDEIDDNNEEREALLELIADNNGRREELQHDLEGVSADLSNTLVDLQLTREQIPVAQGALAQAEDDLAASERHQEQVEGRLEVAEQDLSDVESEISAGEEAAQETSNALGELARSAYRGDAAPSTLALITESASAEDFIGSYSAVSTATRTQSTLLTRVAEESAENRNQRLRQDTLATRVSDLNDEAIEAVAESERLRNEHSDRVDELAGLEALQEDLVSELEGREDDLNGEIAAIGRSNTTTELQIAAIDEENRRLEQERLEEERRQQEAAEQERLRQEAAARQAQLEREQNTPTPQPAQPPAPTPTPTPTPTPDPPSQSGATFIPPVPRPLTVTSPYGPRIYPITGAWSIHPGVDLRSACGNSQVAIADGVVEATNPAAITGTSGNQVIINHGIINGRSTVSTYHHLSGFAVTPGQHVSQGQVIGFTGATGNVTGCHTHLGLFLDGQMTDPMAYL
jgi:murein DD-endopeptidase MepM/ murein hydrolase activator NlpD